MIAKTKLNTNKFYWVVLSQPAEWGGKRRSPMHQYRLKGNIVKAIYDSCKTITPTIDA